MNLPPGAFSAKLVQHTCKGKPDWQLCDAIVALVESPLIDLGAGNGRYVKALRKRGVECDGVDGCPDAAKVSRRRVSFVDLSQPVAWEKSYRWGLCLEVGEHVPPELEATFCDNVANAVTDGLILSWARRGQYGSGHVNCLNPDEVTERFTQRGFVLDEVATKLIRVASLGASHSFCKKLLVLRKTPQPATLEVAISGGRVVQAEPLHAQADRLVCRYESDGRQWHTLVEIGQAMDRQAWLRAWRKLGGGGLTFEDGTPYEPS